MSNLLKHWIGTDRNSVLKSISAKPLKITTRDALIVTALTIVVTMIMLWIYYSATDVSAENRDYVTVAIQTAITSMAAQYLYEYSGTNNMIAESSLRYAKGSTLSKYVSRREAVIYQCFYKLVESPKYKPHTDTIKHNFDILKIILTEPNLCGDVTDYITGKKTEHSLRKGHPTKHAQIDKLLTLPRHTIEALNTISDHVTEHIAYDILVNGFDNYRLADTLVFSELSNKDEAMQRGEQIAQEVDNEE